MKKKFPAFIAFRAEPQLKADLNAVADRELTSVGEFVRRQLRVAVASRLPPAKPDDDPTPFSPDRGQRIAA